VRRSLLFGRRAQNRSAGAYIVFEGEIDIPDPGLKLRRTTICEDRPQTVAGLAYIADKSWPNKEA
jgi:hypothetical protein